LRHIFKCMKKGKTIADDLVRTDRVQEIEEVRKELKKKEVQINILKKIIEKNNSTTKKSTQK
jgi:hypothetical protein